MTRASKCLRTSKHFDYVWTNSSCSSPSGLLMISEKHLEKVCWLLQNMARPYKRKNKENKWCKAVISNWVVSRHYNRHTQVFYLYALTANKHYYLCLNAHPVIFTDDRVVKMMKSWGEVKISQAGKIRRWRWLLLFGAVVVYKLPFLTWSCVLMG